MKETPEMPEMREMREISITYKRLLKNMNPDQLNNEIDLLKKSIRVYGTNELRDLKINILERLFPRLMEDK